MHVWPLYQSTCKDWYRLKPGSAYFISAGCLPTNERQSTCFWYQSPKGFQRLQIPNHITNAPNLAAQQSYWSTTHMQIYHVWWLLYCKFNLILRKQTNTSSQTDWSGVALSCFDFFLSFLDVGLQIYEHFDICALIVSSNMFVVCWENLQSKICKVQIYTIIPATIL